MVELLPDREPATVEAWLRAHPEIEIVARDRNGGYRTPQPETLFRDGDNHFIKVPLVVWAGTIAFDASRKVATKAVHPQPNCLPADDHAAFGKQIFNIRCTQSKSVIRPNRIRDHLAWKTKPLQAWHDGWYFHCRFLRHQTSHINLAMPLRLIQDYLGHHDPRHTAHYTRTGAGRFERLW